MNAPFSRHLDHDVIARHFEGQPYRETELTPAAQVTAWLQISLMGLCILGFLSLLALCVVQGGVK